MKIRIGNKFLSFLGAMTLEIYLVHVLFVELFCKTFIGQFKAFFYIKNPFLYLLAVLVLTFPIAFVIRKIRETLSPLITGGEDDISWVLKILRTAAIAAIAILLLSTAYFSISSHFTSFRMRDTVSQYQKDFNTMTEVDGKMLSAYVAGEGAHTILILGDAEDPAPSMLLRPLADHLAEDYRVILPDFFGCGFSDPTDKPRNAKALAEELHTLTEKLTGGKPVTIFSYGTSGVCALTYLSEYPEDVEGLMGYDLLSPEILKEKYDNTALSKEQIFYAAYCSGKHMQIMSKLMKATGFIRMELVTYNEAFTRDVMKDHIDTLDELFIRNYANPESIQYRSNMMTDARDLQCLRLPTGFPAIFLSSNWSNAYEVKKPAELLKKLISDENCQRISVIAGDSYSIYYQARDVAKHVKEFMKDL
jgi:pimeloyl-ACP methyl ester carboxylesterase